MSFQRLLRTLSPGLAALLSSAGLWAAEPLNFRSAPLTAGKALLTENGYWFNRELGIANFSPELRLPVQLFYKLGE